MVLHLPGRAHRFVLNDAGEDN